MIKQNYGINKKKICENYELEENKIAIESENNYD